MATLIMLASAIAIILLVKYGLVRGLEFVAEALNWSPKARGQATGFATSVPEFVCLVAAGLAGVWEAGLWNIAASNIINTVLMIAAAGWYRQLRELKESRFYDEIGFALAAVAVPIVLMQFGLDQHWAIIPVLLGFFFLYRIVDKKLNAPSEEEEVTEGRGNLPIGTILILSALIAIAVVGIFLGDATEQVVNEIGLHPAIAGWILGLMTSLPEMVTFFSVYSVSKKAGELDQLADTQEALDNLTASNMSNVGIIYPVGLGVYLVVSQLMG
jgi:Ca2+/Na+ antiporter